MVRTWLIDEVCKRHPGVDRSTIEARVDQYLIDMDRWRKFGRLVER